MNPTKLVSQYNFAEDSIEELVEQLITPEELKPSSIEEVVKLPPFFEKMKECERLCETTYSEIDHSIQNALVLRRLQQMTNTLMLNPLWKERIEQSGLKEAPRNFEEWQQLPISDKETMRHFFMGERPGMVVPLNYGGFEIVASGGTSGDLPVETVYSLQELDDTYKIAGQFIGQYVLPNFLTGNDPKWAINTYADYQMWSSGTMVGGVFQKIPNVNYIGAGPVRKEVYQHMMSYKGSKAIVGMSQTIGILGNFGIGLSEEARTSLRAAFYCSGVLPYRKQLELKEFYPNLEILSYFSATQAEAIAMQLSSESYLAIVPGLFLIEVVDDEGRWVAEGEEGELVLTRLHVHKAPLIRYKLGDKVVRRPNLDAPRLKTQQFEFVGRSGDTLHLTDTQFSAPRAYAALCHKLKAADVCELEALAHEFQFFNNRRESILYLIASVDDVFTLTSKMKNMLGEEGITRLFKESLGRSLSIFNEGEANPYYLEKTGYRFEIKFVNRWSEEIYRTELGKVPLIRDIF
ncbi:MAG: hypothetical protein F6K16_01240 [Symploca sp. SIO2B6]|nr:hypothetical protein [Symploca sp. SIO2B6]